MLLLLVRGGLTLWLMMVPYPRRLARILSLGLLAAYTYTFGILNANEVDGRRQTGRVGSGRVARTKTRAAASIKEVDTRDKTQQSAGQPSQRKRSSCKGTSH